jgi:hypothetical protein
MTITLTNASRIDLEKKLDRLLRYHRLHAFDSDAHARAIVRLKRTPTAQAIFAARRDAEHHRVGQRLLHTWA